MRSRLPAYPESTIAGLRRDHNIGPGNVTIFAAP